MQVAERLDSEREEMKKRKKATTHQVGSRRTKRHDQQEASRMQGKDEKLQVEPTTAGAAAPTASEVTRDDFEGDVDKSSEQNEAFGRRQLARRERKKPAACVSAFRVPRLSYVPKASDVSRWRGTMCSWWDAQRHEPVLKRAKVIHHSTRGSPPGGQVRRASDAGPGQQARGR